MTIESSVELAEDGSPAFVRRAGPGPYADRLRWETAVLRLVDHPGTVQLLHSAVDDHGAIEVATAFAAGGTLETRRRTLDVGAIVAVATALADTLTAAHASGIVHGSVTVRHILFDTSFRPRLCGWADASYGGTGQRQAGRQPADDVAGLGTVLADLLHGVEGDTASALRALAGRATADDPRARPPMAAVLTTLKGIAADLERTASGRVARDGATASVHAARSPVRPMAAVFAGVSALAAIALMIGAAFDRPPTAKPTATATVDHEAHRPSEGGRDRRVRRRPPSQDEHTGGRDESADPEPLPHHGCLPDGSGGSCAAPVTVEGGVVAAGARRWRVADREDPVVLGRWACERSVTPAVLKKATGSVWVYDRWADDRQPVPAEPVGVVEGAVALTAVPSDGGCDHLLVERADGTIVELDPTER